MLLDTKIENMLKKSQDWSIEEWNSMSLPTLLKHVQFVDDFKKGLKNIHLQSINNSISEKLFHAFIDQYGFEDHVVDFLLRDSTTSIKKFFIQRAVQEKETERIGCLNKIVKKVCLRDFFSILASQEPECFSKMFEQYAFHPEMDVFHLAYDQIADKRLESLKIILDLYPFSPEKICALFCNKKNPPSPDVAIILIEKLLVSEKNFFDGCSAVSVVLFCFDYGLKEIFDYYWKNTSKDKKASVALDVFEQSDKNISRLDKMAQHLIPVMDYSDRQKLCISYVQDGLFSQANIISRYLSDGELENVLYEGVHKLLSSKSPILASAYSKMILSVKIENDKKESGGRKM